MIDKVALYYLLSEAMITKPDVHHLPIKDQAMPPVAPLSLLVPIPILSLIPTRRISHHAFYIPSPIPIMLDGSEPYMKTCQIKKGCRRVGIL